jgi:hypothetical protein
VWFVRRCHVMNLSRIRQCNVDLVSVDRCLGLLSIRTFCKGALPLCGMVNQLNAHRRQRQYQGRRSVEADILTRVQNRTAERR